MADIGNYCSQIINVVSWRYVELKSAIQGRPQDLAGGPRNFFFRFGKLHVAKRHAAHGEAMRFARGVRGHAPPRNFLKWCNLVRFGVYFDQILSLKNFKNCHFYIEI